MPLGLAGKWHGSVVSPTPEMLWVPHMLLVWFPCPITMETVHRHLRTENGGNVSRVRGGLSGISMPLISMHAARIPFFLPWHRLGN